MDSWAAMGGDPAIIMGPDWDCPGFQALLGLTPCCGGGGGGGGKREAKCHFCADPTQFNEKGEWYDENEKRMKYCSKEMDSWAAMGGDPAIMGPDWDCPGFQALLGLTPCCGGGGGGGGKREAKCHFCADPTQFNEKGEWYDDNEKRMKYCSKEGQEVEGGQGLQEEEQ